MPDLAAGLRRPIANQIRSLLGSREAGASPLDQPGDAGLFGPTSACWRVHGDFTSMMVGGVTALLLQMLHPRALAGVWDHSNFRHDMSGRLKRTAQFIAGTTYGSTVQAEALIAGVRQVHDRVHGVTADGQPYSAHDPDLLTWVHVAEATSFLAAWRRYRDPAFSPADQDRYFAETARVAERLGAADVPRTRHAVETYLHAIRPQLRCDARTREVAQALLTQPVANPAADAALKLLLQGAQDLLPPWAARMHGFDIPAARRPAIRLGVQGLGAVLRWALTDGAEVRARRRTAAA